MQLTNTTFLNTNLPIILVAVQGLNRDKINSAIETHKTYFLPFIIPLVFQPAVSQTISERLRPDLAIAKKVRARLPEAVVPSAPTDDVGLLRVAPDFPEPMFDALAAQSLDLIMPGLDKFPLNRCGLFESNQTFIEAYMVGLNHEMAREMLWREFPADLRQTFFRQFWDKRDTPATGLSTAAGSLKDIRPIAEWGKPTPFGDASHRVGASANLVFFVLRGDLLRKYPEHGGVHAACHSQTRAAEYRTKRSRSKCRSCPPAWRRTSSSWASTFRKADAIGNAQKAGWYVGLQERPGDIHFGLDQSGATSPTGPELGKRRHTAGAVPRSREAEAVVYRTSPCSRCRGAFLPTGIHDDGSRQQDVVLAAMIDLAVQQAKFREKRRDQLARQKELYNAGQAFQLVLDEINAKLRATGAADLPASDPLKVKQAALAAAMPGLQEAAKNAEQAVRGLFDELYAETDFQKLLAELKGDTPFLLFPVRLETRFCRTRHFARPVSKDWFLDFSNVNVPDSLRGWGLQTSSEGTALQVRAPFPGRIAINEVRFNSIIETAISRATLNPPTGNGSNGKQTRSSCASASCRTTSTLTVLKRI